MKVDFDTILKSISGENLKEDDEKTDLKLSVPCINSLLISAPQKQGERPEEGRAKLLRYKLAKKIYSGGVIDVTAEEISLLKQKIGEVFGPALVGPAFEVLEGLSDEETQN